MAAHMAAQVSRAMHGRKVDVLISAPNLMRLSIHDMASKEGQLIKIDIGVLIEERENAVYIHIKPVDETTQEATQKLVESLMKF